MTERELVQVKKLHIEKKRLKKVDLTDSAVHFFCFLSVLFIGADIIGVNVGVNLRLDQVFLVIFSFLLVIKNRFVFTTNYPILLFMVFSLISVFTAYNPLRGALFYASILYNVVFIFFAFENYVRFYGIKAFVKIFRKTMYIQFAIILLQFLLKVLFNYELPFLGLYNAYMGIPRYKLWFYEPSYLVTYLSFWFALSCYKLIICGNGGYLIDALMGVAMFIISTSTSGFIALALVLCIVFLWWFLRGVSTKKIIVLVTVVGLLVVARFVFSTVYDVFVARLFSGDLIGASGGRITGWAETFEVFKKFPLFGVGPGNYGLYVANDSSVTPSNVTLELMATLGIFATIVFYAISLSLIIRGIRVAQSNGGNDGKTLIGFIFALVIFTVILQFNQGYLRLYHWMFLGLISGSIKWLGNSREKQILS